MNDRPNQTKDFSPFDSRANLFYFLRITSGLAENGKVSVNPALAVEQVNMQQNHDRAAL